MGNLYGFEGPLPQGFIDADAEKQKKIMARMRELGMLPVTPGFSGFVPPSFAQRLPNVKTISPTRWCGFAPTVIVEPREPFFAEISKKFIEQYKQEYGELSGYYLIDLFNEMNPKVGTTTKNDELRVIGEGVYKALHAADAEATWVMQGWLFYHSASFWNDSAIAAFVDSVPTNRMILLDLGAEQYEVWRNRPAFAKRQIIWNMLHGYGQRTPLTGELDKITTKPVAALKELGQSRMVGMGLTMEGIEQNSVMYELMSDMMWRTTSPDARSWVAEYAQQRYGTDDPRVIAIWNNIYTTFYKSWIKWHTMPYQKIGVKQAAPDYANIRSLIVLMLSVAPELKDNPLFIRDLVDVSKRYFGEKSANFIVKTLNSSGDARTKARTAFTAYMNELDALLATVPQHRLDRWIANARATVPEADKNLLERNARVQLTTWVNLNNVPDYAQKEWSGMVNQYYLGAWNAYFDAKDVWAAKQAWTGRTDLTPPKNVDPVEQVKLLLALTDPDVDTSLGIAVGKPVTASAAQAGYGAPSVITDGVTAGGNASLWSADPYPQWVMIDLESEARIDSLRVFPFVDSTRYYQYTIDVSSDKQTWTQVVDMSTNTRAATTRGMFHAITPVDARYIKVTMLKNNVNPGVHLYEVRVFGEVAITAHKTRPVRQGRNLEFFQTNHYVELSLADAGPYRVCVYTLNGKTVRVLKGEAGSTVRIDGKLLRPGIYLMTAHQGGTSLSRRIVVQKPL
jgi:alpha-N-acetylglucosaminidase